jgi:hypothetical protein
MIDPIRYIRAAIVDHLSEHDVYDAVADNNATFPFIIISRINYTEGQAKHCTQFDCDITLEIFSEAKTRGGNLTTDLISDDILSMLDDGNFSLYEFKVESFDLINSFTSGVNLNNRILYRRTFNLKLLING